MTPDEPAPAPVRPYGRDVARAERDYEDFSIWGTQSGLYAATQRVDGCLVGDALTAESLDELVGKMDRVRHRLAGM